MRNHGLTALVLLLVGASWTSSAAGLARFDFDQPYFIQPGFIVKDHTLVEAPDDSFHLFYIKADESLPESQRARALGHASSADLVHWSYHPDVIPVVASTWEESFVWAPHIVQMNGLYFMFYTGVNRYWSQAIGVAVSQDLYTWYKFPGNPVYRPSNSWAAWSPTTWSNCRDPFVFEVGGTWYMTTTAHTAALKGALSLASSTDLTTWTDLGPLLVHPGPQAWHVLESSNVHVKDGLFHLFMTEQNIGGSTYMSAPTLLGPWNYTARQPFDAGHATEVFQIRGQWALSRHTTFTFQGAPRYTIKFDDLDWNTSGKPLVRWRDPLAEWTLWSGDAFYLQPTFWDNSLERGGAPSGFAGNSWIGTNELFTGPLQVGYPGLAAGVEPQGRIRSPHWSLLGDRIAFRIGGGQDLDNLYVALYTADDNQMQLRATGSGSDAMQEVVWDVSPWAYRHVFLEVADLSSGPMGYINVDEILEFNALPSDSPRPVAARLVLHPNTPNPFNPSTRIALELPGAGRTRLAVYDARGRLVRSLVDGRLPGGPHVVTWDGRDGVGGRVASGVYYSRLVFEDRPAVVRSLTLVK